VLSWRALLVTGNQELKDLGDQGWELVTVFEDKEADIYVWVFKRLKSSQCDSCELLNFEALGKSLKALEMHELLRKI